MNRNFGTGAEAASTTGGGALLGVMLILLGISCLMQNESVTNSINELCIPVLNLTAIFT